MKDMNCAYCTNGELLDAFGIKICDLTASQLYLFKEQSHKGRVILAHKDHIADISEMSDENRAAFFADMAKVSKALKAAFQPDKINYGAYADTAGHMHFHLVPKYKDEFEWGTTFAMNPGQTLLTDEEYTELIAQIKAALA